MKRFYLLLLIVTTHTFAIEPNGFYFFGDSLTDSGYQNNNPTIQRLGKTPLWTSPHGHTWAYYFLQNAKHQFPQANTTLAPNNIDAATFYDPVPTHINPILDGNNFAAGGSTTGGPGILNNKDYKAPSLLEQVRYFITIYAPKHATPIAKNEYLIWSGSNDLMKKLAIAVAIQGWLQKAHISKLAASLHLFDSHTLSKLFHHTQTRIANDLLASVVALQRAGAQKIVVILLPDLGVTPLITELTQDLPQKQGLGSLTATQLSTIMQTVVNNTNALIRAKLVGSRAVLIDINPIMRSLTLTKTPYYFREEAIQFGKQRSFLIANNKTAACPPKQLALTCIPSVAQARQYVFEDAAHPTDQTHQIIGDYLYYQSELMFSS